MEALAPISMDWEADMSGTVPLVITVLAATHTSPSLLAPPDATAPPTPLQSSYRVHPHISSLPGLS